MFDFAIRNLLLYFKDRTAVLLSFLAEFIVIGLYILFIRDNLLEQFSGIQNVDVLMDVWMIAGILGITSVTTTMGAYGIMVDDKVKKIEMDFWISPIRRDAILSGYMISAVVIGFIMTMILFLLSGIYIFQFYKVRLGAGNMGFLFCVMLINTMANSSMVLFLVSFLRSSNALASCCTIAGALIGFLTGIYLPIGNLPESVQWLVKCFPVSHGVVLFRQILSEPLLDESFKGMQAGIMLEFMEFMGIRYTFEARFIPVRISIAVLFAAGGLFLILTMLKYKISRK